MIAEAALDPIKQGLILESVKSSQSNDLLKIPKLMKIIEDNLLEAPPANGVAKRLKNDKIMAFEDEKGTTFSKIMQTGERLIASISGVTNKILEENRVILNCKDALTREIFLGMEAMPALGESWHLPSSLNCLF